MIVDVFEALTAAPANWAKDALCVEHLDLEWFPDRGQPTARTKAICARCLVRDECLAFALKFRISHGVWGGTTPTQRRRLRQSAKLAAVDAMTHAVLATSTVVDVLPS